MRDITHDTSPTPHRANRQSTRPRVSAHNTIITPSRVIARASHRIASCRTSHDGAVLRRRGARVARWRDARGTDRGFRAQREHRRGVREKRRGVRPTTDGGGRRTALSGRRGVGKLVIYVIRVYSMRPWGPWTTWCDVHSHMCTSIM